MYCTYCKQKNNVISILYGKTEYIACEKCGDAIGSEEKQQYSEAVLETPSYETMNLEVFAPLHNIPRKFESFFPKYIPVLQTVDVPSVDLIPAHFQTYVQFGCCFFASHQSTTSYDSFFIHLDLFYQDS